MPVFPRSLFRASALPFTSTYFPVLLTVPHLPFIPFFPSFVHPSFPVLNWHFHIMVHVLEMEYLRIDVQKNVDVAKVVQDMCDLVERRLQK
ncbi:hypothetical protein DFH08DRAFT_947439 [Mycena albidolilacea]|uniref:Uncharacterized protein n=1 Tax=Mycena albidolilacea TaxID=1033008 RepID=A0AAD7AV78_9AGAR|nr:hypothetical protein DFH08DRAFT_947439 [Mycena albidolilacea]